MVDRMLKTIARILVGLVAALVLGGGPVAHGASPGGGFGPAAASFLNGRQGWVLGRSGCESCARLFATTDGGARWTVMPRLPVRLGFLVPAPTSVTGLYFADSRNGYLFGPGLELTHDGGRTGTQGTLPRLEQLTGGAGFAYALHETDSGTVRVWRNAAGSNGWVTVPRCGQLACIGAAFLRSSTDDCATEEG